MQITLLLLPTLSCSLTCLLIPALQCKPIRCTLHHLCLGQSLFEFLFTLALEQKLALAPSSMSFSSILSAEPSSFVTCCSREKKIPHWLSIRQAWGRWLWSSKTQTSAFLNLPIDILYSICHQLPLSAKILLSQACRVMWYILRDQCSSEFKSLHWGDRSNTLLELGNFLPDHYYCTMCDNIHPAEYHDIPNMDRCDPIYQSYRTNHPDPYQSRMRADRLVYLQYEYKVSFTHVQLALKYARMEGKHQDCRMNILSKAEVCPQGSTITKYFTAQPKVINGRFILLAEYVLHAHSLRNPVGRRWKIPVKACPHHWLGIGEGHHYSCAPVLRKFAIAAGAMQDRQTELFSCDSCPTDYSVGAGNDEVIVKAWYDLGSGLSVEDPSWQSHLWTSTNGILVRPKFKYEHGSISKLYDSARS